MHVHYSQYAPTIQYLTLYLLARRRRDIPIGFANSSIELLPVAIDMTVES